MDLLILGQLPVSIFTVMYTQQRNINKIAYTGHNV